jgi:hypothetical protein
MTEVWKPVNGYEGLYEVSNYGKVKALRKFSGTCFRDERILSMNRITKDGYIHVALTKNGKVLDTRLHKVVAENFVENPDKKETVNHIDGNKLNNRADNLEWADRREQLDHAYRLKLKKPARGQNNTQSKLTEEDVRYIRKHYKRQSTEFGTVALSKKFGVSNRVIGLVARGLSYKNVK